MRLLCLLFIISITPLIYAAENTAESLHAQIKVMAQALDTNDKELVKKFISTYAVEADLSGKIKLSDVMIEEFMSRRQAGFIAVLNSVLETSPDKLDDVTYIFSLNKKPLGAPLDEIVFIYSDKTGRFHISNSKRSKVAKKKPAMYMVQIQLIPVKLKYEFEKFSDYVMDAYPTGDWIWDIDKSSDDKKIFTFYTTKYSDVVIFFRDSCDSFGMAVGSATLKRLKDEEWKKIQYRIDNDIELGDEDEQVEVSSGPREFSPSKEIPQGIQDFLMAFYTGDIDKAVLLIHEDAVLDELEPGSAKREIRARADEIKKGMAQGPKLNVQSRVHSMEEIAEVKQMVPERYKKHWPSEKCLQALRQEQSVGVVCKIKGTHGKQSFEQYHFYVFNNVSGKYEMMYLDK
ncbi:MAG: hypothetical protein HRU15_09975 [Planctomycetes bacterium]|nr:hypothetical protein [Planctomycetota bacterium]